MLGILDGPSESFIFVYDRARLLAEPRPVDAGAILSATGFHSEPTAKFQRSAYKSACVIVQYARSLGSAPSPSAVSLAAREPKPGEWNGDLDLREFARNERFPNPQYVICPEAARPSRDRDEPQEERQFDVGMVVECKALSELGGRWIELQLGMEDSGPGSPRLSPDYPLWLRDRLFACVEALVGLPAFEVGFRVFFCEENTHEDYYRERFSECIQGDRFSLARLIRSESLTINMVAAGGETLRHYGRQVFDSCPAWRVSQPSSDSVCVFFESMPSRFEDYWEVAPYRQAAMAHLKDRLVD